jgi:hypothetical protein
MLRNFEFLSLCMRMDDGGNIKNPETTKYNRVVTICNNIFLKKKREIDS